MIRLSKLIAALLLLCGLSMGHPAAAQTADPQFQADVAYNFGQLLTFRLIGQVADSLESATLFFQAPEFDSTYVGQGLVTMETAVVPQSHFQFQASHEVDLATVRLAPFTQVRYWWVLHTALGAEIRTPEQSFVYADNQFEWRNLAQGNTTVYWTGNEIALGQVALDVVVAARPSLQSYLSLPDDLPLTIYIYPTSADLRAALRLTGRDWVGAHAMPELGVILVTAVNIRTAVTDLGQSLPHEMFHFYLYQTEPTHYQQVPAWLNEGLATLVELSPRPTYEAVLQTAVTNQSTIPFSQLCTNFPSGDGQILLAYAQSQSFVQFIQNRYGQQKLQELTAVYSDGANCQTGVERTLSTSLDELNRAWLQELQPRSPLLQFLRDNSLLLILLLGSLGITSLLLLKNPL